MNKRIGFVGTGFINTIHATAARGQGAVLAAAVNHRTESCAVFADAFEIPRRYTSIEELLAAGGIDGVVIGTPNVLHARQAIAALEVGVGVLVEKPMAITPAECEAMLAASRRSGAPLMVAHCWRFDDEVRWVRDHAAAVGPVVRTKSYSAHTRSGPTGWFTQRALAGGGALADMGIHALDTTRFLLGDPEPLSVYARMGTYYGDYDVEDTGLLLVNWENGATSTIEFGWHQPHSDGVPAATQLYGRDGLASLFPTRIDYTGPEARRPQYPDPGYAFPRIEHVPQSIYDRQMATFLTCLETRETPVPGGIEGWVNVRIVAAAYESARTGQVVRVA